jgi:hypothetical protein
MSPPSFAPQLRHCQGSQRPFFCPCGATLPIWLSVLHDIGMVSVSRLWGSRNDALQLPLSFERPPRLAELLQSCRFLLLYAA